MNNAARWDGTTWTPLGGGVNERIGDFLVFDDGGGPALLAAGVFSACPESGDAFLARWSPVPDTTAPVLSCPASITVLDDLANGPGETVTFTKARRR